MGTRDFYRIKDSASGAPSQPDAANNRAIACPAYFAPFRQRMRFFANGQEMCGSAVRRLLDSSGPFNITRLVVSVIIDAVKSAACWARANAFKKLFNRLESELDSTPAVSRKIRVFGVVASRFCVIVGVKFRRRFSIETQPVRALGHGQRFSVQAPTGFRVSLNHGSGVQYLQRSTVASNIPKRIRALICEGDHGKASESFSRKIYEFWTSRMRWKNLRQCADNIMCRHWLNYNKHKMLSEAIIEILIKYARPKKIGLNLF